MNNVASILAAVALTFAAAACAAPQASDADVSGEGAAEQTSQAMTSNGFICNSTRCVCDPDSDNPVDSCDGMMSVCDRLGRGMLCEPGGWCFCLITANGGLSASPEPTNPAPPRPTRTGFTSKL